MTPTGIEPATFRFVSQQLNHNKLMYLCINTILIPNTQSICRPLFSSNGKENTVQRHYEFTALVVISRRRLQTAPTNIIIRISSSWWPKQFGTCTAHIMTTREYKKVILILVAFIVNSSITRNHNSFCE